MYSELTDSSLRMRRMVSASSPATDSWRIFLHGSRVLAQRDGVGHHQLVERRLRDALDRAAGQHRVRAVGHHLLGAVLLQRLRRLAQRARRCRPCRP